MIRFKSLKKMHDQYGSVIRVGPKAISIGDKDLIKSVLVHHDLPKSPIYNILKKQGESMFNTTNKQFHKNRRRLVSPAFSIKYLSSLEPFMASVMNTFINKINQEIDESTNEEGYAVIDIWCLLQHVAFDIIGETAFGQTFHMIENKGDHCVMKYMLLRFKLAAYVISYMSIAKFLFSGRIPKKVLDVTIFTILFIYFLNNIYTSRKEENNNTNTKRKDILQALIDTQDATQPEDRLSPEAILIETYLFLAAGSETTSNTVGFAIIELLRHPSKLKKLYQEIDTVPFKDGSHHLLCHDTLKKLPYLNGVINETLRLNPVSAVGFPRYTDQDILLGEHLFIPKETTVVCNGYYAQLNDKYWPNASQFLPERWIPGEKEFKESKHVDAFFPFSSGSRNCIGKNFAYQEMRIIIASILKNYEIVPIKDEMQHATHLRQYLTLCIAKRSFKIKIIKRV
ncbi:cytochrome P450 [Cokeromyces recurvatus]|uniref:cytochrome P450 n=1 Tax=Cokeromyces recurvatus TaxID=90255 RepID=UPI00221E8B7D|nr:cytochrome P450 [Cokeromyces recurvatus]KAI7905069.1 cytochrome P450 [Cokeromyces recurvatus]